MKIHVHKQKKFDIISSIWDDEHIHQVDRNIWQCLWCNKLFQGINSAKALARTLSNKGV